MQAVLILVLLGLSGFAVQACTRNSCRWTRLQCRNGGRVNPDDCSQVIKSGCGPGSWNSTVACICPPGFYGKECQLTKDRACPEGYIYVQQGFSKYGIVESECFLDYTWKLDSRMLFLRHHRITILSDVKAGFINLTLNSRSGGQTDFMSHRCTKAIDMFSLNAFNCEVRPRVGPYGEKQVNMYCTGKTIDSCKNRQENRLNCPRLPVIGFERWAKDDRLPLEVVFTPGEDGQFRVSLELSNLPVVGSINLSGQCQAGMCVRMHATPADVDLDAWESNAPPTTKSSTPAFIAGFVALAVVTCLLLTQVLAIVRVTKEAHRPIKDVFDRSETSSSASEQMFVMTPALERDGSAGTRPRAGRGLFWDSLAFGLRPRGLRWLPGDAARRCPLLLQPSTVQLVGPELVALVGRSGCGKSTLLDLIAGVHKPGLVQGDRGRIGADTTIGYVTQSDVLLPALTVWETIEFAARTRSPPDLAPDTLRWMVASVLADLGLESQAGSMASSLSGGEARRLALASDLICAPDVLLLDEPTTGLDSATASLVVNVLRKHVVLGGRLVLLTIHQPARELFPLFDRVLLMGPGGRIVYNGTPADAIDFVAEHTGKQLQPGLNPFEFILEALDDSDSVDDMFMRFSSREAETAVHLSLLQPVVERCPRPSLPFWRQVGLLCERSFRNSVRCSRHLALYYAVTVVVALFLGLSFVRLPSDLSGAQSRLGFFSCAALFVSLTSMASLDLMLTERLIQRKETPQSYSPTAYVVARIAVDLVPYRIIPALVFAAITYPLVGLQAETVPFLMFALILTLVSIAAGASTALIALLTQRFRTANLVAVLYYLFNFCLGSSLISRQYGGLLGLLRLVAIFNYATEALCAVEFHGLTVLVANNFTGGQNIPIAGDQYLLQIGMRANRLYWDIGALGVAIGVLYGAALLAIRLDPRRTRRHSAWVEPEDA